MKRFGRYPIDENELNTTGEMKCRCCEGTGTNPDYREVNVIQTAINNFSQSCSDWFAKTINSANIQAPYCLACYGLRKIDWVQYANGACERELIEHKESMHRWFLKDIEPFLRYIHCGEVIELFGWTTDLFHFDWEKRSWFQADGINHDLNNLKKAYIWLNKFRDDGYFDLSNVSDAAFGYQELYVIDPSHYFESIKAELLRSKKMTIERLLEIKKEMDLFWYDIGSLKTLPTENKIQAARSDEFEFTWKSILSKFGLSMEYLSLLYENMKLTLGCKSESGQDL
jgi:hypothetical protein